MTKTVTRTYYYKDEKRPELVVGAVCTLVNKERNQFFTVYGARHYDMLMHAQIQLYEEAFNLELVNHSQGFYTNRGRIVDRKEALEIAKSNNQIIFDIGYKPNELYSEMIY